MRTSTGTTALIVLGLIGGLGVPGGLTAAQAKPTVTAATPAQLENAGQAYARLTEADGQLDNFNSRAPVAAKELVTLGKADKRLAAPAQPLLAGLKMLMVGVKPAQASSRDVQKKWGLLKTGKISYAVFQSAARQAAATHQAVLSAAVNYKQSYGKVKPQSPFGMQAVNARAMANYCDVYAEKMKTFWSAARRL